MSVTGLVVFGCDFFFPNAHKGPSESRDRGLPGIRKFWGSIDHAEKTERLWEQVSATLNKIHPSAVEHDVGPRRQLTSSSCAWRNQNSSASKGPMSEHASGFAD